MVQILFIQSYLYMFFLINTDMKKYSISNKNNKLGHLKKQEAEGLDIYIKFIKYYL